MINSEGKVTKYLSQYRAFQGYFISKEEIRM